ncbi:hypothetical protein GGI12_000437 [Dipsacomyces acuminosporus]|nr:hypothetical protein GGI12_000437 [Dipsacomyces acuminosporus]
MEHTGLRPATYIGIHERTRGTRLLYISSGIRHGLLYEPSELIGKSPETLISDDEASEEFKTHHGSATDDNVIMTNLFATSKTGIPVYLRTIAFACGNVNVGIVRSYPHINSPEQLSEGPVTVQRYKCILSDEQENSGNRGGLDAGTMYSMRTNHQACFVLSDFSPNDIDGDSTPKIIFTTDSINRILDVDSCDLQNVSFLSLVTMEDRQKAYEFVEKSRSSNELVLERLDLLSNPIDDAELRHPRSISVEFMGIGSDDGVIMLCQLTKSRISNRVASNSGYLSLEDIISSDPETSDFPDEWRRMDLPQAGVQGMLNDGQIG